MSESFPGLLALSLICASDLAQFLSPIDETDGAQIDRRAGAVPVYDGEPQLDCVNGL